MYSEVFVNREDAGRRLAQELTQYAGRDDVVVLGLPRGGAPVALEVAKALDAPMDVFVVRKLGVPGREEFAMGAIATGGVQVMNEDVVRMLNLPERSIENVAEREFKELVRREKSYREGRGPLTVRGRVVIVVDDGLATGATMRAAVEALRRLGPEKIIAAAPVAAPDTARSIQELADGMVTVHTPEFFEAVGAWYRDFSQTSDEEVRECLREAPETPGRVAT
jgi:predicted phosphoribosyltransferase